MEDEDVEFEEPEEMETEVAANGVNVPVPDDGTKNQWNRAKFDRISCFLILVLRILMFFIFQKNATNGIYVSVPADGMFLAAIFIVFLGVLRLHCSVAALARQ